ncbi:exported hypothetical protein [Rhodospirillaceae bacterium LM-1]|nr:exported hypothetical protein [Rhodospirillaceae bacterium LM-1]
MMKRLCLLVLLLALPLSARADVGAGRTLIEQGSYEQAFYMLLPLAEDQDPTAQYLIGGLYLIGRGVPQDPGEARKWLTRAAHNGHAEATMALGDMAAKGFTGKPDPAQALVWYRRAAELGVAAAQNNLGIALASGKGTHRDMKSAVMWLERAARQGNAEAQFNLGHILSAGGPQLKADPEGALMWYAIAVKSGLKEAGDERNALTKKLGKKSKLALASAQRFVAKPETGGRPLPTPPVEQQTTEPQATEPTPAPPTPTRSTKAEKPETPPATAQPGAKPVSPLPPTRKMSRASYKVQVASGPNQGEISKEASRLRFDMAELLANLEVSIVYGEAGFTALMGPLATPDEAEALCAKLKARGHKHCSPVPP